MIDQIQQQVLALNSDQSPYVFTMNNSQIDGYCKVSDSAVGEQTSRAFADIDYRLSITLDESKGTYTVIERQSKKRNRNNAIKGSGSIYSSSRSIFSGKGTVKHFGYSSGGNATQDAGTDTTPSSYSFDSKYIKDPLFSILQANGFRRSKKGVFGRWFS